MDSLRGVAIGALIVAAAEVLASRYIAPQVALAAPFLVLLVALCDPALGIRRLPTGARTDMKIAFGLPARCAPTMRATCGFWIWDLSASGLLRD